MIRGEMMILSGSAMGASLDGCTSITRGPESHPPASMPIAKQSVVQTTTMMRVVI
jgi:hypothetical protein